MSYAYGTAGKLSSVGDGTTTFADTFTYGPNGGLTSEHFGNTAVHTVAYNHALQASQVKLTLTGTVLQQFDYDYGTFDTSSGAVDTTKNTGQIGKITGTNSGAAQWNQGFSYDELGRLSNIAEHQGSSMSTSTYSQGFSYDLWGNKKQSANTPLGVIAVAATDYDTTHNNNQFVSAVATYDAAGNITTDSKFRGLTYAYDANGRQSSATNGSWTESQTYDSVGQRVLTSFANGSTTTYRTMVYDIFGQDVADYTGSAGGTLERENIYRGGQLLAIYEPSGGGSIKYALQDAQGSTRAVMDNNSGSSTILARHDFMPFGEEISSGIGLRTSGQGYGATDTNRQKYSSTERDDSTGLDHTWFRKYESLSGRWTSPDSFAGSTSSTNPQSFNRYSYVKNDPVNFIDPSGLFQTPTEPWDPNDTITINHSERYWQWNWASGGSEEWRGANPHADDRPKRLWAGDALAERASDAPPPVTQRTDAQKRKAYEDCVKAAADDYHKRNAEYDHANAVFVLGYNPDTGEYRPLLATVAGAVGNAIRGGNVGTAMLVAMSIKQAINTPHAFGFEIASWQGFTDALKTCDANARMR